MHTSVNGKSRSAKRLESLMEHDIFEMSPNDREELHEELREAMEEHYSKRANPRRIRKRRKYITKRRSAGRKKVHGRTFEDDHHTGHAETAEQELENDKESYYGGEGKIGAQTYKYALAILTGRYDNRMPTVNENPVGPKHEFINRAIRVRREETPDT